ncbi:MAG TPA: DUF192 domain-containing protein [Bacilli bacterium]|nr:DUF192 domain-containing protein [Bacilli bacterium]
MEFNKDIDIIVANTFLKRFIGFMFKKNANFGLLFNNCNILHTFFMRFNIDVIAIDKNNNILMKYYNIKPFHIIKGPKGTYSMYEFPNGYIK